jgi:AcrR family transcriptional regulator
VPRRPGQPPLTRDRILHTALQRIDQAGLDALSMRRLAADLDVDPMAIYHYLPTKAALVHGVVDRVFAGFPDLPPDGRWQRRVRAWAGAYRALARAHPNLVLRIVGDPVAVGVGAARINPPLVGALEAAGFASGQVEHAVAVLVDYVNGFVLAEASGAFEGADGFAFGIDTLLAGLESHLR